MSSASLPSDLRYDVLNFFYDNEDNCALTALINNVRFHVIADTSKVRHGSVGQKYAKLLQAVKEGSLEEDFPSSDSGIDVREGSEDKDSKASESAEDVEEELQRWMLSALESDIKEYAPESNLQKQLSLEQWYSVPTLFYNLETKDKVLHAVELEPDDDLHRRIRKLLPEISIPKYVRELDIPFFRACDLVVLDGSNSPPPYHPARVRKRESEDVFFLKLVDNGQPQPTKREIPMLHRIAEKGLHEHIRCPKLEGLVTYGDDRTKIMGFLQSNIPNPTPLTLKLDAAVPQELRDRWATETERVRDVLHEHGMVWGDAKADNFMVDEHDELWIIDFGGSYTEGWVDPKLNESVEGDDMGIEKIANALHDPVSNTWDPDTEKSFGGRSASSELQPAKRKADEEEEDYQPDLPSKKQKRSDTSQEPSYCYCEGPSSGRMVACDNDECPRQWFHFQCVGMPQAPEENTEWYCKDCEAEE